MTDEYGTAYPCCGNCEKIREDGFKLMCRKYFDYRRLIPRGLALEATENMYK